MRLAGAVVLVVLSGCGYVGAPLPPALNIPSPATDLRVTELGENIVVRFTLPERTTDGLPLTGLQEIELLAGPGGEPFSRERWAASAQRYRVTPKGPGLYEHEIPAAGFVGQGLVMAVRALGRTGRASDWSTYGYITVEVPLAAPATVVATNAPKGVALQWAGTAPRYRILRSVPADVASELKPVAETDAPQYLDDSTEYGVTYHYVVIGLRGATQQSLPSVAATIKPSDVFPPAMPIGLSAVASAGSIDLNWTRNAEEDLAGYNLFRAEEDGVFTNIAPLLGLPTYSDTRVQAGRRYRYAISASDMAGNESARSREIEVRVQ